MAEQDEAEKTEEPTTKKLNEAKKKGQFAKTKEFNTLTVLLFGYGGFLYLAPEWAESHRQFSQVTFMLIEQVDGNLAAQMRQVLANGTIHLWNILGVPFILLWVLVVGFGMAHNRFVIPEDWLV